MRNHLAALPWSYLIPDLHHTLEEFLGERGGGPWAPSLRPDALPASPYFTTFSLVFPQLYVVWSPLMDTVYWVMTAVFLPAFCGGVGGLCLAMIAKWGQTRFLVELEYRLDDLEGRVTREVKIRAGAKGTEARNKADDLVTWAKDQAPQGNVVPQNFMDWRKSKMVSPQGG